MYYTLQLPAPPGLPSTAHALFQCSSTLLALPWYPSTSRYPTRSANVALPQKGAGLSVQPWAPEQPSGSPLPAGLLGAYSFSFHYALGSRTAQPLAVSGWLAGNGWQLATPVARSRSGTAGRQQHPLGLSPALPWLGLELRGGFAPSAALRCSRSHKRHIAPIVIINGTCSVVGK